MPTLNSTSDAPLQDAPKHTLFDLKKALDPKISFLDQACTGMVIGNLDIASFNPAGIAYKNILLGKRARYIGVEQEVNSKGYKAKILISDDYFATLLAAEVIGTGKKIEVTIERLELGNSSELLIHTQLVVPDGDAQYQLENRRILQECERLGILARPKRLSPSVFIRVGLITSGSSTIESDIIRDLFKARILFEPDRDLRRCKSSSEILAAYSQMESSNQYDAICFFRGGREDQGMSIFRDLALFEKIASANTFTVTGLCHDIDHPVIEQLVDEVFSVPKAFGEAILTRNNQYIDSLNNAAIGVKNTLRIVHEKIEGSLLTTNQLTLGELSKATNTIKGQVDHIVFGIGAHMASISRTANEELVTLQTKSVAAYKGAIAVIRSAVDNCANQIAEAYSKIQNEIGLKLQQDKSEKLMTFGLVIILFLALVIALLLFY